MNFDPVWAALPKLLDGLGVTVGLAGAAIALGFGLGLFLAMGRVYAPKPISLLCNAYIQLFRGTPLMVQLFIIYYGLPTLGLHFTPFASGMLALGLNTAAYQAEYFRGAIQAVRGGQMQAARSVGMSRIQAIRFIVLPQALRLVIPAWSNEFILIFKATSIVFSIAILDLMGVAKRIGSRNFNYFESYLVVAAFYLVIVLILTLLLRSVERAVYVPGLGAPIKPSPKRIRDIKRISRV